MSKTKMELIAENRVLREGLKSIHFKLDRIDRWEKYEEERDLAREKASEYAQQFVDKYQLDKEELDRFMKSLNEMFRSIDDYSLFGNTIELFYVGFKNLKEE